MKNKTKLAKIKNQGKQPVNLPDGWFFMVKEETKISIINEILGADYNVEVWTEAGVAEVTIGEKSSVDIEAIDTDLGDDYSNDFLQINDVKSIFYITFKKDAYEQAKPVLKKLAEKTDGFVCGDTEDFTPRL